MTFLSSTSNYSDTSHLLKRMQTIGGRFLRTISWCIAEIIAWRQDQAALTILRTFNDRELRDIGLDRGQIGAGLANAAKDRALRQNTNLAGKN